MINPDPFGALQQLSFGNAAPVSYYALSRLEQAGITNLSRLPYSIKILLESVLRNCDGYAITRDHVLSLANWQPQETRQEIPYKPARVILQDFTGVPALVDLAAMRDAMKKLGGDPKKINPLIPCDLVIDHSVQVDYFGKANSLPLNEAVEFQRNAERYEFLKWGQAAFQNLRVVPPSTGIVHQVNLEYLSHVVFCNQEKNVCYPDSCVGTDSHTPMVNGLGVLAWGVGGIEAEAVMLDQPIYMLIPDVIGIKLTGSLPAGVTATDLVLRITELCREFGVVGKFVEFFGDGLAKLPLADRATIANMSPEYGATCGWFPIDDVTLDYLRLSNRDEATVALVEAYAKEQGLWRFDGMEDPEYTAVLELDLDSVKPSLAGPKRPQDRVDLDAMKEATQAVIPAEARERTAPVADADFSLKQGDVVIAAITSCTNTSNPAVMMGAGLVAKKAVEKGLVQKPWVKTSLAPGSKVVTDYLEKAGLQSYLDQIGFNVVGYGCTTCIGNSGPLTGPIADAITDNDMLVCSVLSGNRNFEGRIHSHTKASWLASPPLVVAYALAGSTCIDLTKEPLGQDSQGHDVYLKDIWPSDEEVAEMVKLVSADMFREKYADVFVGEESWRSLPVPEGETYDWEDQSTYVREPSFFEVRKDMTRGLDSFTGARLLALLGDSITTDHISPAGSILASSPAGVYLREHGIGPADFNSYGSRRGNHEVMMRGTFANIRLKNELVPGVEGGFTKALPDDELVSIYDAAMKHADSNTPLIIIAGKEYGTGSSRDWAAKGTLLLGVKAVLTESYERIHRSNLVGMGILPLQFKKGESRKTLAIDGSETFDLIGQSHALEPGQDLTLHINRADGSSQEIVVTCRIDTDNEVQYFQSGGILNYVLMNLVD